MNYRIKADKHRAWPLTFAIWNKKTRLKRTISFDSSCKYILDVDHFEDSNNPQFDWNKLFGLGYIKGLHKTDSARFGWRYNPWTNKIEIAAYCHVNGEIVWEKMLDISIFETIVAQIEISGGYYIFSVNTTSKPWLIVKKSVPYTHNKTWSYALGPYFGGDQKAPNTMELEIKK